MNLETDGTLSSVWDQASVLSNSACSIEHFRFAATKSHVQVLNPTRPLNELIRRALTMTTSILKPTSRGCVVLRSARPDAKPHIYHNYLATDHDRTTMIASVRLAMDLFAQPNLSKVRRAPFSVPASDAEADIVAFIEQGTGTNYHPTSTCAIGRIVDADLRVFGTDGLRVADASVMPSIVRGNTNAAVIAIAEKAADILLGKRTRESAVIASALAE